jgi:primosomal protein N' (replication factor Y)
VNQPPQASPTAPAPYVDVAVDARTNVRGNRFTYAAPPELALELGHLVRVPFGKRTLHGVVVALTHRIKVDYVKPVASLIHPEPIVDAPRLALAEWVAHYYIASLFDALAPMLPPGLRGRARASIRLVPDAIAPDRLSGGPTRLLAYLQANPRTHPLAVLTRTLGPWVANAARALIEAHVVEEITPDDDSPVAERTVQMARAALPQAMLEEFLGELSRAPRQTALLKHIADGAAYVATDLRKAFGPPTVKTLVDRGLITLTDEALAAPGPSTRAGEVPLLPTGPQSEALAIINAAQDDVNRTPRTLLLEGVTGSGKTEVYLQALAHCMAMGKRAIVLVPELSLTPQTVGRFEARFPGHVALLHSGLSPRRAWDTWWAVHRGERSIVVGARSALFAPQRDLGLIILDEEHEWTYKQVDAAPRYHARDVARDLARHTGAVVILGSATPDLGSAYAAERGVFARIALPSRIERSGAAGSLPDVRIVDMRDELRRGNRSVFSTPLQEALRDRVAKGQQSILFLNRRGSAGIVECRSCGHVMRCSRCDTTLTLHGSGEGRPGTLVCHHCNRRRRMPTTCPTCHGPHIRALGVGTQRLTDDVQALLPDARVLRWDRDTATTVAAHAEILEQFRSHRADILVGTQMIAKGLDLPSVTLVGVVLADLGLHLPDFRSSERTFQLLTQVAGRAGRGRDPGEVIVQTYDPEHYAIQAAALQDYPAFYATEMSYRRAHGNPPVTRLVRMLFGHTQPTSAKSEAERMVRALHQAARSWDMSDVDIIGPSPAYPPRSRGAWRWHLFVRGANPRLLLDKVEVPPSWSVDVDPVNMI